MLIWVKAICVAAGISHQPVLVVVFRVRLWAQIGWRQRLAGRRSPPRPVLPVWNGPDDHGSPGPGHAAPPILLGRQVIGVGLDKQLFEHRVHDVPPQAGNGPEPGPGSGTHGTVAEKSPQPRMCYGNGKQAQRGAGAVAMQVGATGPSGTLWRRLRRQVEAARAGAVPMLAVQRCGSCTRRAVISSPP